MSHNTLQCCDYLQLCIKTRLDHPRSIILRSSVFFCFFCFFFQAGPAEWENYVEIASQCGEFPAAGLPGPNVARRMHGAAQVLSAPSSYLPHCRGGPVPAAAYITLCVREKVHILVRVKASALPPLCVLRCSAPRGSTEQNRKYLTALLSSDFFGSRPHFYFIISLLVRVWIPKQDRMSTSIERFRATSISNVFLSARSDPTMDRFPDLNLK